MKYKDVLIIGGARTPIGKFQGALKDVPATELGAIAIRAAVERAGIEPARVDEVLMGNVISAGLGQAPARQAAIRFLLGWVYKHVADHKRLGTLHHSRVASQLLIRVELLCKSVRPPVVSHQPTAAVPERECDTEGRDLLEPKRATEDRRVLPEATAPQSLAEDRDWQSGYWDTTARLGLAWRPTGSLEWFMDAGYQWRQGEPDNALILRTGINLITK